MSGTVCGFPCIHRNPLSDMKPQHTHTKKFRKNQNTEKLLSGVPQGLNLQQAWHAYWCPFFSTTIKRAVAVRWERRAERCSGISMYETSRGRCRTGQTRFYSRRPSTFYPKAHSAHETYSSLSSLPPTFSLSFTPPPPSSSSIHK